MSELSAEEAGFLTEFSPCDWNNLTFIQLLSFLLVIRRSEFQEFLEVMFSDTLGVAAGFRTGVLHILFLLELLESYEYEGKYQEQDK